MGDSQLSLIPHFSDGFRRSRVRNICLSKPFAKIQGRRVDIPEAIDDNKPLSVDRASQLSIDRHLTVSIDAHHQRSGITFHLVKYCPYGLSPHQS
ncbi:hypothetical protein DY000_02019865 [Brassica cretica]|uniref:Uncharacterized protein n=1 Tax=Brassica cretica TaxID=69181 RepID=A0ABQ7D076_BRACR|nr:hypothetical protein DY000_02019865 [Brassica cretica]